MGSSKKGQKQIKILELRDLREAEPFLLRLSQVVERKERNSGIKERTKEKENSVKV